MISLELIAPNCDAKVVHVSGSFNEWNTNSGVVTLTQKSPGYYRGEFDWKEKHFQYKYHLGDWDQVELDHWGAIRSNRSYSGEEVIRDYVPQFLEDGTYYKNEFLPRIEVLPANLPLPKAFATRRIAALLPHGYDKNRFHYYPVLYLQDGQNLYDEFAPYGNWSLDKRMAWLAERGQGDFIVVAIDHAEEKRIKEYAPPHNTKVGAGEADAYGEFLVNHLKPLIDKTYRTIPDRENTAIGGSSMGAVASLHVGMTNPQHFGKLLLFSPSIWIDPELPKSWPSHGHGDTHVYLYGGMEESKGTAATFSLLARNIDLVSSPKRKIYLQSHFEPRGKHNEKDWGKAFPKAIYHLLYKV